MNPIAVIAEHTLDLHQQLTLFLEDKPEPVFDDGDHDTMYTQSPKYLAEIIAPFHTQSDVLRCLAWLADSIEPHHTVWDVGCSCGFTGLVLAKMGRQVGFHDFEGLALDFIRHYAALEGLEVEVYPYPELRVTEMQMHRFKEAMLEAPEKLNGRNPATAFEVWAKEEGSWTPGGLGIPMPAHRDWAIALDVIEHTGNQLGFLRWMKDLGSTVVFSIPDTPFLPPYVPVVDAWVDTAALVWTIEKRYHLIDMVTDSDRTYVIYR